MTGRMLAIEVPAVSGSTPAAGLRMGAAGPEEDGWKPANFGDGVASGASQDGVRLATTGDLVVSAANGAALSFASGLSIRVAPVDDGGAASAEILVTAGKSRLWANGAQYTSKANDTGFAASSSDIVVDATGDVTAYAPTVTIKSDFGYKKYGKLFSEVDVLKQITYGVYCDVFLGATNSLYAVLKYSLQTIANRESMFDLTIVTASTFTGGQKVEQWEMKYENDQKAAEADGALIRMKSCSAEEAKAKKEQDLVKLRNGVARAVEEELDSTLQPIEATVIQCEMRD